MTVELPWFIQEQIDTMQEQPWEEQQMTKLHVMLDLLFCDLPIAFTPSCHFFTPTGVTVSTDERGAGEIITRLLESVWDSKVRAMQQAQEHPEDAERQRQNPKYMDSLVIGGWL